MGITANFQLPVSRVYFVCETASFQACQKRASHKIDWAKPDYARSEKLKYFYRGPVAACSNGAVRNIPIEKQLPIVCRLVLT
jgi:hypothetical protein